MSKPDKIKQFPENIMGAIPDLDLELEGEIRLKQPIEFPVEEYWGNIELNKMVDRRYKDLISIPFYCDPRILNTGKNILMASTNIVSGRITGIRIFEPKEPKEPKGTMNILKEILKLIFSLFLSK